MISSIESYTRAELRSATGLPEKGYVCKQCGATIPEFAEMDDALRDRFLQLIDESDSLRAIELLVSELECPLAFAKTWVIHRGEAKQTYPGPPCPYCGKPLHTSNAKRCKYCLEAWHNREPPEPAYAIFNDVIEAASYLRAYDGELESLQLAIAEDLLDPTGMNLAIITDSALGNGWIPDGYHQMDGFRIYRFSEFD